MCWHRVNAVLVSYKNGRVWYRVPDWRESATQGSERAISLRVINQLTPTSYEFIVRNKSENEMKNEMYVHGAYNDESAI